MDLICFAQNMVVKGQYIEIWKDHHNYYVTCEQNILASYETFQKAFDNFKFLVIN